MKKAQEIASNVWSRLKLYCDCHDEETEYELVNNPEKMSEPYFRCPVEGCVHNHYLQRVTFLDFEKMADEVAKTVSENLGGDITNYRFKIKRTIPQADLNIKVKYTGKKIGLAIK